MTARNKAATSDDVERGVEKGGALEAWAWGGREEGRGNNNRKWLTCHVTGSDRHSLQQWTCWGWARRGKGRGEEAGGRGGIPEKGS